MKPSISTAFLGGLWLGMGVFVAINGIVAVAAALLLSRGVLKFELSAMPAPLDFITRNALVIGPIQFLVGIFLGIGGFALMRKRRCGRWIIQFLSVALMLWFLFLGFHTFRASEEGHQTAFSSSLPIGFGMIALGASVWALCRPQITAELTRSK